MVKSVFSRVDRARIVYEPYPYVVAPEALDPALYAELEASFPSFEQVVGERAVENNKVYLRNAIDVIDAPEIPEVWRHFFAYHVSDAFFREMLEFWSEAIAREYPDLEARFGKPLERVTTGMRRRGLAKTPENLAADVLMDVQFGVNSPVAEASSVRGPHIDKPEKLFAALLYFRHPDDAAPGGDLELYRFRTGRRAFDARRDLRERDVERFRTVSYAPNTLVAWLNTERSLHGVTPRAHSPVPRRYVNFLAECYRLTSDGFFTVPRTASSRALSAVRRALGFRDA
jgi:hypothetical protein